MCILDAMDKVYEIILREILVAELKSKIAISERQFGFREGSSTLHTLSWITDSVMNCGYDWCVFVTLDVKNVFNTV